MDGAMLESFAVDWHTGFRDEKEWQDQLAIVDQAQKLGKRVILVAQGDQDDFDRQQYAFASYLLVANGSAAFRYAKAKQYNQTWIYKNYDLDIGDPAGPRYQRDGLWKRDFTKGTVTVDPVNHKADIGTAKTQSNAKQPDTKSN